MNPTQKPTRKTKVVFKTVLFFSTLIFLIVCLFKSSISESNLNQNDYAKRVVNTSGIELSVEGKKTNNEPLVKNENVKKRTKTNTVPTNNLTKTPFKKVYRDVIYLSDLNKGHIGKDSIIGIDDPKDNFFKITLPNHFSSTNKTCFLEYDIHGLDENSIPSKSINENYAIGGYLIKKENKWIKKSEEIDANWLKKGENIVFFNVPKNANYNYIIKNVTLRINDKQKSKDGIVLNNRNHTLTKGNKRYVSGFLRNSMQLDKILANNQELKIKGNSFEGFVDEELSSKVTFKVYSKNEVILTESKSINSKAQVADEAYAINSNIKEVSKWLQSFQANTLNIGKAKLKVGDSALAEGKIISAKILRNIDTAPLSSGMVNVTDGGYAYRFLPDGTQFNKPIELEIPFNQSLIPQGYTSKDIKTYYFDVVKKEWVEVQIDSINDKDHLIVSNTTHFTDYINGIITAPDSPQTNAFSPTMMTDIKAADPSSEITLIAPPSVSQKGEANITYPIKIPAGRKGMQPQLSLQYNSDAGNGWLGIGWNINTPAITIETRWGTPVFDQQHESEIYVLNGAQLMYPKIQNNDGDYVDWIPNRHYDASSSEEIYSTVNRERISSAVFTPRKQGSFSKIERLGSSPSNYYWKVTTSDGTVYWYGGKTSLVSNAVIKDAQSNIVHWALYQVEDVYGNNIKYHYTNSTTSGFSGANANLNGGKKFRIANIYYTGYNDANGAYRIQFLSNGSTTNFREDPIINARLGVKQVETGVLEQIRVLESGNLIRRYRLLYGESVFYKSRLDAIVEYDGSGQEFYRHTFDYYNDVDKKRKHMFSPPQTIDVPDFSPNFTLDFGNILGASRINSGEGTELAWEGRIAAGISLFYVGNDPGWLFTVGATFGENYTKSKGKITLADMDGNGLSDVLYRRGNTLKYFPHKVDSNGDHIIVDEQKTVININNFQNTKGKTETVFGDSYDFNFLRFFAGKKRFKTKDETDIYITDGNGDMLPDIVNNNNVYFNTGLNTSGNNVFETSSERTPNMLITADPAEISPDDVEDPDPTEGSEEMKNYDVVRVWIAPIDGHYRIKDSIEFLPQSANSTVTYSIERESQKFALATDQNYFRLYLRTFSNSFLSESISLPQDNNYNPPLGFEEQTGHTYEHTYYIQQGDKVYFRLHKNLDEENDVLRTNPIIEYLGTDGLDLAPELDQNNLNRNRYRHSEDFILGQDQETVVPNTGTVKITWNSFNVANLSDELDYKIVKKTTNVLTGNVVEDIIYSRHCNMNTTTTVSQTSSISNYSISSIPDNSVVSFKFTAFSDSNLNWKDVEWKPKFEYLPDANATSQGAVEFTKYPIPEYSIFLEESPHEFKLESIPYWQVPNAVTTYQALPNTYYDNTTPDALTIEDNGNFLFVMKKEGITIGKREISIDNGVVSLNDTTPIPFYTGNAATDPNDILVTFEFYANGFANYDLLKRYIRALSASFYGSGTTEYTRGTVIVGTIEEWNTFPITNMDEFYRTNGYIAQNVYKHLGNLNRGWGQFLYNDELDDDPTISSDSYSKLINNDIVITPVSTSVDILTTLGIDIDYCTSTYTDPQDIEDCITAQLNDLFNIPAEGTVDEDTDLEVLVDDILDGIDFTEIMNVSALMSMNPFRYVEDNNQTIEKWIGFSDNQYSSPTEMKDGEPIFTGLDEVFENPDDEESSYLVPDENTGMAAITIEQRSSAKSYSAGWGSAVYSDSKSSYSNAISSFTDINGDRYPDLMTSVAVQKTNMTGGHTTPEIINLGALNSNASNNSSLSVSGSYPIAGRKQVSEEKQDSGNPSYAASIGLSANLAGRNKELNQYIDLNGDGLTDRIVFVSDNFEYNLNQGTSFSSTSDKFQLYNSTETHPNTLNVSFGLSGGFNVGNVPFSVSLGYSTFGGNTDVSFQDMNGDGLVDLLLFDSDNNASVKYNVGNKFKDQAVPLTYASNSYLSLFSSSKSSNVSIAGDISQYWGTSICCWFVPIIYVKFGGKIGGSASLTVTETERQFSDFNNDGYPDYVKQEGTDLKVYYSNIGRTDKLKSVTNPLGGEFTVDYENKTVDYENPTAKWVMSNLTVDDGHDIEQDGYDIYHKSFAYKDGFYDRRERDFYGYESVEVNEYRNATSTNPQLYRTTQNKFFNKSYFLQGLLVESKIEKASGSNTNYSTIQNKYGLYKVKPDGTIDLDNAVDFDYDTGGTEGRRQAASLLLETTKEVKDFSSNAITSTATMTYDEYGRVITFVDHGDMAITSDDYYSAITYHELDNNILNVPRSLSVYNGTSGTDMVRNRSTEVNTTTGAITKINAWLTGSTYAEIQIEYDNYGNVIKKTLPQNGVGETMFYSYEYDDTHHKYITKITDAFGYNSESVYDSRFDKIVSAKDMASNNTVYKYDDFGRLILITGPKEIASSKPYTISFEYMPTFSQAVANGYQSCVDAEDDFIPVALTKHFDVQHSENDIETITFMDGLARPIQVKKDIQINVGTHENPEYKEFMSVSGIAEYDEFGRTVKQYHPKKEPKHCATNFKANVINDPLANYFVETSYDELDRPLVIANEEGNDSNFEYTITSDGLDNLSFETISIVDQGSQNVITHNFKDSRDRITSTKNIGPSGDIWTKFIYNPIGELIEYNDDQDLSTTLKYDHLGRRIEIRHPDSGTANYKYDLLGNMLVSTTANMNSSSTYIEYKYEYNRLTEIIYPNVTGGTNISNVRYGYGAPGSGNEAGRLVYQQDATGKQLFKYGNMGEVIYNERVVIAPNLPSRIFKTEFEYDSFNRLQKLVYPDGEKVGYIYDWGGNLNKITGTYNGSDYDYVKQVDYDRFEQKTFMLYGNGTSNSYAYDPALRRLDNLTATAAENHIMINNSYKYDKVGNILAIENDASYHENKLGGKYYHSYKYDNLNRLASAEGAFKGYEEHNAKYSLKMAYNNTHGITAKGQSHDQSGVSNLNNTYSNNYKYIDGTHQVEAIYDNSTETSKFFKYDLNGNILWQKNFNGDERNMYWDESNRLRVLAEQDAMQHYIYDASGERILKAGSHTEQIYENGQLVDGGSVSFDLYTTYPSAYLVINANQRYSKHYYFGSQRITSKLGELGVEIFDASDLKMNEAADKEKSSKPSFDEMKQLQISDLKKILDQAKKGTPTFKDYIVVEDTTQKVQARAPESIGIYFFHPNHLGSSSFLTDGLGNPYQFYINLPFGETMYEQHSYSEDYVNHYKFSGKEMDSETGLYYYGARYYEPNASIWMSVDPLAEKYPSISPYVYANSNPVYFIDPDGRENIPALIWAAKNMANKGIPFDTWYGGNGGWTFKKGVVPTETVCYESCWTSYMNGADSSTMSLLKTGFSTKNGGFVGRSRAPGGMAWFKAGDGTDREFVTDISKGELGDIVFMGETGGMQGHAVLLASEITKETIEVDGKKVETMSFYVLTTSSDTDSGNYGGEQITWTKNDKGEWIGSHGNYKFRGYGQMKNVETTEEQKKEAETLIKEVKKGPKE